MTLGIKRKETQLNVLVCPITIELHCLATQHPVAFFKKLCKKNLASKKGLAARMLMLYTWREMMTLDELRDCAS